MNKQEFSGKTLDEALINAARSLGTEVSLLSYNILPQASGGLLSKLFQRGVRLEAWVDSSNDVQAAAREAVRQAMAGSQEPSSEGRQVSDESRGKPRQQRSPKNEKSNNRRQPRGSEGVETGPKPRSARHELRSGSPRPQSPSVGADENSERIVRPRFALTSEQSKQLLSELGAKFVAGFEPAADQRTDLNFLSDEEVVVSVNSQELEETLTKSDRLSCAFEHLFKRIAQKRFGDISGRVLFNSGNALQLREDRLKDMALSVAAKVKETGKTITLSSKSSQERRVIHLALENMEGIGTKSIGVGDSRKLIVFSTDRAHRKAQNSRRRQQRARHHGQGDGSHSETEMAAPGNGDEQSQNSRRPSRRRGRRGGNANRPQQSANMQLEGGQNEQDSDRRDLTPEA